MVDGRNPVFSFSLTHFLSLIFVYIVYDLLIVFIIIIICVVEAGSYLSFDWQFCSCPPPTPTSRHGGKIKLSLPSFPGFQDPPVPTQH